MSARYSFWLENMGKHLLPSSFRLLAKSQSLLLQYWDPQSSMPVSHGYSQLLELVCIFCYLVFSIFKANYTLSNVTNVKSSHILNISHQKDPPFLLGLTWLDQAHQGQSPYLKIKWFGTLITSVKYLLIYIIISVIGWGPLN